MLIHEHSHLIEWDDNSVESDVQKFLSLEFQYLNPTKLVKERLFILFDLIDIPESA